MIMNTKTTTTMMMMMIRAQRHPIFVCVCVCFTYANDRQLHRTEETNEKRQNEEYRNRGIFIIFLVLDFR